MRKSRTVLLALAVVVAGVVVIAVVVLYSSLDSIVKAAIERYGTDITGTKVTVGAVEISPKTGRGTIRDLRVANPAGFPGGDAFRLREITVEVDISTLTKSLIVVNEVSVIAPEAAYVMNEKAQSNVGVIRDRVQSFGGTDRSGAKGEETDDSKRLRIRRLNFEGGRVEAVASVLGKSQSETVALPPLWMSDVGGAGGAPPDEIGKIVMTAYVKAVTKAIADKGIGRVVDKAKEKAKESATGALENLLK
jgi:hypothetical protein